MELKIKQDNVLNDLKTYEDNYFHTIISDPPYNLSTEWIIGKNGNPIVKNKPKDFMNKWEGLDETALETLFTESFRVVKYGGFVVMFGLNRQLMPFNYYAMKAGFEICQSLYWFFASSMPKATDVSKQLDKRFGCEREVVGKYKLPNGKEWNLKQDVEDIDCVSGTFTSSGIRKLDITAPSSDLAKQYDGYKYSIAPFKESVETIMIFRKPVKVSVIDDIINNESDCSPSCINIDGGRIVYTPDNPPIPQLAQGKTEINTDNGMYGRQSFNESKTKSTIGGDLSGRYPSTVFVDDDMGSVLDTQSGIRKSGFMAKGQPYGMGQNQNCYGKMSGETRTDTYADSGGVSRILHHCNYEKDDFHLLNYHTKVQKSERNGGCDELEEKIMSGSLNFRNPSATGRSIDAPSVAKMGGITQPYKNNHPCLKPISLLEKITTLFKLPIDNQKVYVPFAGTFSEVIGIALSGINDITCCEMNEEYIEIGKARFDHWIKEEINLEDCF